ncbi:hypothetical protein V496_09044 [Pseudogymnoascus sp. VKM F-4515 (FW-2607)]|nr:hypothetical protein V496_09044 [Pseudogymnoascus sp. VKM F-4515 (FW-2607)]
MNHNKTNSVTLLHEAVQAPTADRQANNRTNLPCETISPNLYKATSAHCHLQTLTTSTPHTTRRAISTPQH